MKRIVILTGSELRHDFVRKGIASSSRFDVARTYCEGTEKSLRTFVKADAPGSDAQIAHVEARTRSEEDFFRAFVDLTPDRSHPVFIPKGDINLAEHARAIIDLAPDVVVAYGCSLIKEPLLSAFAGRFLNVHLGLSPYYRGAGTNFWALVNGEPEFVGATFMHIDAGVDTGKIVHQVRARIYPGDTPHQIGNRLIADMVSVYVEIIARLDELETPAQLPPPDNVRVCRSNQFSPESVASLHARFEGGLVTDYLRDQTARESRAPLIRNRGLEHGGKA